MCPTSIPIASAHCSTEHRIGCSPKGENMLPPQHGPTGRPNESLLRHLRRCPRQHRLASRAAGSATALSTTSSKLDSKSRGLATLRPKREPRSSTASFMALRAPATFSMDQYLNCPRSMSRVWSMSPGCFAGVRASLAVLYSLHGGEANAARARCWCRKRPMRAWSIASPRVKASGPNLSMYSGMS